MSGPDRLHHLLVLRGATDRLRAAGAHTILDYLIREAVSREKEWKAVSPPDNDVRWISPYHMVLDIGLCFRPGFSAETAVGEYGECFDNARVQVREDETRWIYCEGFAICDQQPDPVQHAWIFDALEGQAIEITWPPDSTGLIAVGVPIVAGVMLRDLPHWKNMFIYHYENGQFAISKGSQNVDDWWHNGLKKTLEQRLKD